jgi:hypothetical protein
MRTSPLRTQPPGFRWLVGGFALLAAVAFGFRYHSGGDRGDLVLGAICLVAASYWLIFDRQPAADDQPGSQPGSQPDSQPDDRGS